MSSDEGTAVAGFLSVVCGAPFQLFQLLEALIRMLAKDSFLLSLKSIERFTSVKRRIGILAERGVLNCARCLND